MQSPKDIKSNIKSLFTIGNISFLLCLVLASLLWLGQRFSDQSQKTIDFGINYIIPEGKSLSKLPKDQVKALVSGQVSDLFLYPEDSVIDIELSPQDYQQINSSMLTDAIEGQIGSKGMYVNSIIDQAIEVNLSPNLKRTIPLMLRNEIKAKDNYKILGKIKLNPDSVVISGPDFLVNEINEWLVDNDQQVELVNSLNTDFKLIEDSSGLLEMSHYQTNVLVNIDQKTERSIFLSVQTWSDSIRTLPKKIELRIETGLSEFDQFSEEMFLVGIDTSFRPDPLAKHKVMLYQQPNQELSYKLVPEEVDIIIEK